MVRTAARVRAGALALALTLGTLLTGCTTKDRCGVGASSPTAAVDELLRASAENDLARACTVTQGLTDEDLASNVAEIAAFLENVGGPDEVMVREVPGSQMGSSFLVEVLVADSLARVQFDVLQSGGTYVVVVGEQPSGDEPTTDPEPPPTPTAGDSEG